MSLLHILTGILKFSVGVSVWTRYMKLPQILQFALSRNLTNVLIMGLLIVLHTCELIIKSTITYLNWKHSLNRSQEHRKYFLCPFALYYLPNRFMSNFIISRIFCREGGIKSVSVVLSALAVYNVNTLYFNARSFPEKSAKTGNLSTIKTQCPSQLSCIHIRWKFNEKMSSIL